MVWLANRHNIAPAAYYKYRLFRKGNRDRIRYFVQHHEICALLDELKSGIPIDVINNKYRFYQHCSSRSLPTPPVLAYIDGEKVEGLGIENAADSNKLPPVDLFAKPTDRFCGIGAECWRFDSESGTWQRGDQRRDAAGLLRHLKARAEPYILQKTLRNHPQIESLSLGGLATARIVTFVSDGELPQVLIGALRMPVGTTIVDNFAAGGIASGIDEQGVLSRPAAKDVTRGEWSRHPDTNHKLVGCRLPEWSRVCAMVAEAHASFPDIPTIGWDVGWTPEGPTIVEGNLTWCAELVQIAHDSPLGLTPFPRLYLAALARKQEAAARLNATIGTMNT